MNDKATNVLARLQRWYASECNGDWEHSFGIKIETLDNPGWMVEIDLAETQWAHCVIPRTIVRLSDDDWLQMEVTQGRFVAAGDPGKLQALLELFFDRVANGTG